MCNLLKKYDLYFLLVLYFLVNLGGNIVVGHWSLVHGLAED